MIISGQKQTVGCYVSINTFLPSLFMLPQYLGLGCYEKFSPPALFLAWRCPGISPSSISELWAVTHLLHFFFSQAINPCSKKVCDPNADCIYLGPNRHKCTCREGYRGDGQVCLPIDPCQAIYGNCPAQSTICIYDGPGKVSVERVSQTSLMSTA